MVTKYWFSCRAFTIQVNVQDGIIVWTAPVAAKFIGQPFENLRRWVFSRSGMAQVIELMK